MNARTYPHNAEAEASVLGAVLIRGEAALFAALEHVKPDDFHLLQHRAVFNAMVALGQERMPIDAVTLEQQLAAAGQLKVAGGLHAIVRLGDHYRAAEHVGHHAATVRSLSRCRALAVAAGQAVDEAGEAAHDPEQWIDTQEGRLLEAASRGQAATMQAPPPLLAQVWKKIAERAKSKTNITGVETGFAELDRLTGGLQPDEMIVVAARPSMGKTALILNIAANACVPQQRDAFLAEPRSLEPVLFFSLEMSALQLMQRLLCSEARVDQGLLRSGAFLEDDLQQLALAANRVQVAPLRIDDTSSPTILEMRARARRFRDDKVLFPPDGKQRGLIVVDYLQLARGSRSKYDLREQEISEISRGLKALAKELHMPVVALSQLNRAVDTRTDHRPQLSDLRESGAIEQDADVVAFLFREERYLANNTTPEERRRVEGRAEVIVEKQRNGPVGTAHLTFIKHLTRFEDASKENL